MVDAVHASRWEWPLLAPGCPAGRSPCGTPSCVTSTPRWAAVGVAGAIGDATMAAMAGDERIGVSSEGLDELDALLGLDVEQADAALAVANSEAGIDLLQALRDARERSGISDADLAERLGSDAHLVLDEVGRLGADPHLSSLRRYAGAIGVRLELAVSIEASADLPG